MKRSLIQFLFLAVLSLCSTYALAQNITVRGQLVDAETGEPLVGAAVMVEGTTQGSVTNVDGYFEQRVAPNATLLFKYVGYKDLTKDILRMLLKRRNEGVPVTSTDIASTFGINKQKVGYHIRILVDDGLLMKTDYTLGDGKVDGRRNALVLTSQGVMIANTL